MTITVTTPTGRVGSRVVRLLIQAGIRPRVLVRDPARLDPAIRERVEVVVGDQTEPDAVARAVTGAAALYWCAPDGTDPDPARGYARLGEVAARAVEDAGVGHVVFQSSIGAEARHGIGEIDGLAATELALEETGAAVLHLRCGYFFTNLLMDPDALRSGVLTTNLPLDGAMPWVAPRDIGDVAAARLLARDWTGRQVQAVHGPADLSWHDVAEVLTAATGQPFRAEPVTDDDVRAGLRAAGLPEETVEGILGMSVGLRDGFVPEQGRDVLTTTPTTLGAWAFDHVRPLLQ